MPLLAAGAIAVAIAGTSAAQPPTATPELGDVFNGFAVGALTAGEFGTPDEIFRALTPHDPFYEEPALTGTEAPGTVLKYTPVDVMFTGLKPANLRAYKIMYVTTGLDDDRQISTGIVMIPEDGRDDATRSIVTYQMANDSVGAYCHPSTMWTGGDPLDGASWSALGPLAQIFGAGHAVVITDVGNDGDPDPHGVFAGKFAGHAALDVIRAATSIPETGLSPSAPVGLFGIAGGGVGAAMAAEQHATYAPELDIRATVLEGMVVNQRNFIATADGSVGSGFAFATLLGLEKFYPEMRLDEKLNPAGRAVADVYRTQCQTPAYFTLPFLPLNTLFEGGQHPADIPDFQPVYDDNLLGRGTPRSEVLVASCVADDSPMSLVPAQDSRDLVDSYRSRGTNVTYAPTDCSMGRFVTNLYGWGTDLFGMQTVDWLSARLDA